MHIIPLRHEASPAKADYRVGDQIVCSIGPYSYAYPKVVWWPETPDVLSIGNFCSIAMDTEFLLDGGHEMSTMTTYPFENIGHFAADAAAMKKPHVRGSGNSYVGNDVWIGREAMILSGVSIGDGAIIGARAVIAKDVAPYQVMVGNPAKRLRSRFDDLEIGILLRVQWWNWPIDKIRKNVELIMSRDVQGLLAVHLSDRS